MTAASIGYSTPYGTSTTSLASTSSTTTSSSTTTTESSSASDALLTNYDTFLKMLTTQLKVQNPLEPMDAEKFTQQLVQYSAVEQQIKTNSQLEAMLTTMVSSTALSLVNYIGKNVEAAGDVTQLADGEANWKLDSDAAAEGATVQIINSAGAVVYETTMDLKSGENSYTWDGKLENGSVAPDGDYQIKVTATDEDGETVDVSTRVKGTVTAVDTSGATPYIEVNGVKVPLSSLLRISS